MQGPIHHAISGISHSTFNPQRHGNLYLDLNNLPLNEAMGSFHTDGVPHFLRTALAVLLETAFTQTLNDSASFINDIEHVQIRKPTPPHPNCQICQIVTWIITSCPNPQACYIRLQGLNLITLFEVNRELWCRLSPKPLLVQQAFLNYAEKIDYATALISPIFFSPLQPGAIQNCTLDQNRLALHEWRNGLAYLAYRTLKSRGEVSGRVASTILAVMFPVAALQFYIFYHDNDLQPAQHHFMLDTIRLQPQAYAMLKKLSQAVGSAIGALPMEVDYWPGRHEQYSEEFQVEDTEWYQNRLSRCVQTMMALNNIKVFIYDNNIANTFVHIPDCIISPGQCYCRFVRFLQNEHPLPE